METIIVQVDTSERAAALLKYFKTLIGVRSVKQTKYAPLTAADWVRPGRHATDEEIEQMLDECEKQVVAGLGLPLEKARASTKKRVDEWKKKNVR